MLDPVAVRSYLGSLGQQGGGQGDGVQALLASLRNRLYGPQAQGGMNQTPGINPNAGGPYMPNKPNMRPPAGPAEKPAMDGNPPIFQAEPGQPQKLPWQQLREAGMQGTGSAAGNRVAAAGLGSQPQITSFPMPVAGPGGSMGAGMPPGVQAGNSGGPANSVGMGGPGSDRGFQSGGGFMAGVDPMDGPIPPGVADRILAMSPPPAVANGLTGFPGGVGDGAGQPQFQSGGGLMAPPTPDATKPPAPTGPAVSPAVLGTQQFQGPNARRINAARQGIFNNVRQALRRPPAQTGRPPVAAGGKVGMR